MIPESFHFLRPAWLLALVPAAAILALGLRSAASGSAWRRLVDEQSGAPADVQHEIGPREDVNLVLDAAAAQARREGVEVHTHPVEGDPADAILNVAEKVKADLLVVGNKGMTGARRFLGSVPNNVSHHAPCSVIIVRTT